VRPVEPLWVKQGSERHAREAALMRVRSLTRYGLTEAEVRSEVELRSDTLGLHGRADALLLTPTQVAVVEFKLTARPPARGELLQLMAYGMLAEEQYHRPLCGLFIVNSVRNRPKIRQVSALDELREKVHVALNEMRQLFERETMPSSSASAHQCGQCEYFLFCNDRF